LFPSPAKRSSVGLPMMMAGTAMRPGLVAADWSSGTADWSSGTYRTGKL
jgi:hypothetical protein